MEQSEINSEQSLPKINFYAEFATKHELYLVDQKVDELNKESASMSNAIEGLTRSVDKISNSIELLIIRKAFNDGMKSFAIKCACVAGTIMGTIITTYLTGIIKIIGKY